MSKKSAEKAAEFEVTELDFLKLDAKVAGFRFVRGLVSVVLAGLAAQYGDSQYYLLIAPILLSVSKFLRDHYDIDVRLV